MSKKKVKEVTDKSMVSMLPFWQYNEQFEPLQNGRTYVLEDRKSEQNSYIPVKICDENVYMSEPDGKLIPEKIEEQHKCDYLLYCMNQPQACYIELKGKNISTKKNYNPYDQIIDTRDYLKKLPEYKSLFTKEVENHAFIVSPEQQKIPRGIEIKQRKLLSELTRYQKKPEQAKEYIHYVKVTPSDRYSDKIEKIICSSKNPLPIPYKM